MAQLGADVEQLDELARKMNSAAADISALTASITGNLASVWWQGADRGRFESSWGEHQRQLATISQAVIAVASEATTQAAAQRAVSQ